MSSLSFGAVIEVDDTSFEAEVLRSAVPVVVDFYATWCGPCRMLAPAFEEAATTNDKVKFVKIDVDKSPNTADRYGIASIPSLILFKGGVATNTKKGTMSASELIAFSNS